MKTISYTQKDFGALMNALYKRPSYPSEIEEGVKTIILDVKKNGNKALAKYAEKFDGAKLKHSQFLVSEKEIGDAAKELDSSAKKAIETAIKNVTAFAKKKLPADWIFSPRPGVKLGERFEPLSRIAVYIPGGTAPLVSTVIHTTAIAKTAGVKEIAAITPPGKDGKVHPAVLYAMKKAGVTEIYRLGGVYGIAALAYGTETIRKVEKIVGPGNAYVTAAKKLVYGEVAIDMIAGPSEIMVIADSDDDAEFIAADILSQAEHGSGLEQAVLLSTSKTLIKKVEKEVLRQAKLLTRSVTVDKVLNKGVFLIHAKDINHAIEIAGNYAPEHLEIMCRNPWAAAKKIKAAGAIFIGRWTPEPVGDFTAGPSHVLPTAGCAKFFSGLTVETFFRRMSIVNYDKKALMKEIPAIAKFAEMEGLDAHGNSALIRRKQKN